MLTGKPKVGKTGRVSLAIAVASGGPCFGKESSRATCCAYLEEDKRRLQRRMTRCSAHEQQNRPKRLTYCQPIGRGCRKEASSSSGRGWAAFPSLG